MLSFTCIVCSARKQKVAAPELIYLDKADEQIDDRNDDEEDEEGEIVQLVVRHSVLLTCLECELFMLPSFSNTLGSGSASIRYWYSYSSAFNTSCRAETKRVLATGGEEVPHKTASQTKARKLGGEHGNRHGHVRR
jgi:hypothetical protein